MATSTTTLDALLFRESGSVTVTRHYLSRDGRVMVIKLACVGDDGNGIVPATQMTNALVGIIGSTGGGVDYQTVGYYLTEVWSIGGATLPDAADIAITDELACVLYTEANVIAASTTPKAGTLSAYRLVTSLLTMTVSNQATGSAVWDVYLKFVK